MSHCSLWRCGESWVAVNRYVKRFVIGAVFVAIAAAVSAVSGFGHETNGNTNVEAGAAPSHEAIGSAVAKYNQSDARNFVVRNFPNAECVLGQAPDMTTWFLRS
jgi:hypothetical protein